MKRRGTYIKGTWKVCSRANGKKQSDNVVLAYGEMSRSGVLGQAQRLEIRVHRIHRLQPRVFGGTKFMVRLK